MAYRRETLRVNPLDGTRSELIHEHDQVVIRHEVDCQPVLDANERIRHMQQRGSRVMGARLAARVPMGLYFQWRQEWQRQWSKVLTWNTFYHMRLNSRDYSRFRTSNMKI